MSLVKSRELFVDSAFPVTVDRVMDRTLMQKELHRHEYFEMLYVERGSLINRFKGTETLMKAGDLLVMKPYVLHVMDDGVKKSPFKAYCCSFLPQSVDFDIQSLAALKNSHSPNRYFFKPFFSLADAGVVAVQIQIEAAQRERTSELFQQLRDSSHDLSEKGYALTRCHFLLLLALLAEEYERDQEGSHHAVRVDSVVPVSRYLDGLRKTLNYIHDHYDQALTLDAMAAMSGTSATYFCRLFKHETGMTFLTYLNGLRIEQACQILRDTTDNALDVCYQVGFNDYTHFGRQFRKNTGMSPAEFRKQSQMVRRIREIS